MVIFIGQLAVTLGILVSLVTVSVGVGARKSIKQKLADFNGHINITKTAKISDPSVLPIDINQPFYKKKIEGIEHIQGFACKNGIIRTQTAFEGVMAKGVGLDFDIKRFSSFLLEGTFPKFPKDEFSNEVLLSKKIASNLSLKTGDKFVMYFIDPESSKPIYRNFTLSGIFQTDIKEFDDTYMLLDLKHIQRLNKWESNQVEGFELFASDIEKLQETTLNVHQQIGYDFYAQSALEKFKNISNWVELFDKNIGLILGIMLLVVCINMVMVLLILILERVKSIGLLKTLGASNKSIVKIFVYYGVIIMVPALIVGNVIGIGFLLLQKYFSIFTLNPDNYYVSVVPVDLNWLYILSISLGSVLIAALVLTIPSLIITQIEPSKTVRYN